MYAIITSSHDGAECCALKNYLSEAKRVLHKEFEHSLLDFNLSLTKNQRRELTEYGELLSNGYHFQMRENYYSIKSANNAGDRVICKIIEVPNAPLMSVDVTQEDGGDCYSATRFYNVEEVVT